MGAQDSTTDPWSARVPVRERYGLILLLVLVGFLIGGLHSGRVVNLLNAVLWLFLLLLALWSPGIPPRLRRTGLAVTVALMTAMVALIASGDDAVAPLLLLFATAQSLALVAIFARILRHKEVSLQTVMGAVAGYALIAFILAVVYRFMSIVGSEPFLSGDPDTGDFGDFVYFSFVTVTTLGYGDVLPVSSLAKRMAVVEAFIGQVFMVTLVARLVALWSVPVRVGKRDDR